MSNENFVKTDRGGTEQVEFQPRIMMDHIETITDRYGFGSLKSSDLDLGKQGEKNTNSSGKISENDPNKEQNKEPNKEQKKEQKKDIDCCAMPELKSKTNSPVDKRDAEWFLAGRNGGAKTLDGKDVKERVPNSIERQETSIEFSTESYDLPDGGTLITAKHLYQKTPFNPILRDKDGRFQKIVSSSGSGAPGKPNSYSHEWSNGAKGSFTDGDDNYHYTDPTGKTSIIKLKDKAYGQ